MSKKNSLASALAVFLIGFLSTFWLGWPGFVVFLVSYISGGVFTLHNAERRGYIR